MSFLAGGIMKITYINHSGFLVETKDCYYIFDYYKGELPLLDKKKEVIVFCSHFHEDHFNPKIFEILDDMRMTYQAVLSKDIRKKNKRSDLKITYAYHDKTYNLDNDTQVDTLLSNGILTPGMEIPDNCNDSFSIMSVPFLTNIKIYVLVLPV